MRGHLTEKADVYAFGIVALELVSGRKNTNVNLDNEKKYLLQWVSLCLLVKILIGKMEPIFNISIYGVHRHGIYTKMAEKLN